MMGEKDKLTFALELAIHEVTKKNHKSEHGEEEEGERGVSEAVQRKKIKKQGYLGINSMIKLPFIIGTPEFNSHPFAGVVYQGTEFDQKDHH